MLRKLLHMVLAIFLLIGTTGFTLSLHYCGENHVSTSINHDEKSCCNMKDCCHNETFQVKIEEDFVSSPVLEPSAPMVFEVMFPIIFQFNFNLPETETKKQLITSDSSPPLPVNTKISLLQSYLC